MSTDPLRTRLEQATSGRYTIEEELGRGGMAVVFAATDTRLKRGVAIKALPPELAFRADVRSRFLREAQMAAGLTHPNIVPIYAVEESNGLVWMVMGRVRGESLAARLAREGRLPFGDIRRILREAADALAHAHTHGVIHRDIKPDNILLDDSTGRVLVTDFGIARAMEGDARLTATGVAVGTPTYMSPEQARGDEDVDGRADVYALGVVGYQMLVGAPPFTAPNTPALLLKHVSEPPPPLAGSRPDIPDALAHAIERALAKDRRERWPTASAMRDALADDARAPANYRHQAGEWRASGAPVPVHRREPAPFEPAEDEPRLPVPPDLPPYPVWRGGGPAERARWRAAQQEWRERVHKQQEEWMVRIEAHREAVRDRLRRRRRGARSETLSERIRKFQGHFWSNIVVMIGLFLFNAFTGGYPWFVFPWIGMGIGIAAHGISVWQDGARIRDLFRRPRDVGAQPRGKAKELPLPAEHAEEILRELAAEDVLAGRHGRVLRRAVEDKIAASEILKSLSPPDRAQLPDVAPTLDALVQRIASLATSLHRLEQDLSPQHVTDLERRLAEARALPEGTAERERRLTLLERQLKALNELGDRREALSSQLESASLVLQTMRLDLLRLRSAGIASAAADVHSVTQEARALSTDIGRVLDAAEEARKL